MGKYLSKEIYFNKYKQSFLHASIQLIEACFLAGSLDVIKGKSLNHR